jgi:hypothetical protein
VRVPGGGNDSFNAIVPYDATSYATYTGSRHDLALTQAHRSRQTLAALAASDGLAGGLPSDGGSAMHPALGNMAATTFGGIRGNAGLRACSIVESGNCCNVGTCCIRSRSSSAGSADASAVVFA